VLLDEKRQALTDAKIRNFGDGTPWILPEEDLARQAIPSLRGYVYQLHQSAAAWIHLKEGDLLHLEVAEDFSQILREPGRLDEILAATQIKETRESGRVNLNSADVLDAVSSLYRLKTANRGRAVRLVFLTTSEIGKERKNPLPSGVPGIEAWRAAAAGGDVAELRAALLKRIDAGELNGYFRRCPDEELRKDILAPLTFVCGADTSEMLEAQNRDDLMMLHKEVQSTPEMAHRAYDAILGYVIRTALTSPTRSLDRAQLIAVLSRATAIGVPSAIVASMLAGSPIVGTDAPVGPAELRALAQALLESGSPPSVIKLFADAAPSARAALNATAAEERTVIDGESSSGKSVSVRVSDLPARAERRHLVIGPPGSGKSHALWYCARRLLDSGEIIPLFLPLAQLNAWADATSLIAEAAPGCSVEAILADERVCVCLDGWSEFATGEHAGEKQKASRALRGARVIATGKLLDIADTTFKTWSLELLSAAQVTQTRERAHPGCPVLSEAVIDLLRLPLLLALHVLSGADASATGDLLRQFHDHMARELPDGFTEALAGAVAALALTNDRSYGRLTSELQTRAHARGVAEPTKLLRRVGTILERSGKALPIHDLYWSWLAGRGLLAEQRATDAMLPLQTRESYSLALQSGASPESADIGRAIAADLVLAATLDTARRSPSPDPVLAAALEHALSDERLAVRNRAGLAALALARPEFLLRSLAVLSELQQAKIYVPEWRQGLRPDVLFAQRAIVADWIDSPGSEFLLEAIAERGTEEWLPWLEQMASTGKITPVDALASALGCSPTIPSWGSSCLEELLQSMPWKLAAVTRRRANRALALHIAENYGRLIDSTPIKGSGTWFHLNRVLVACGDDDAFRMLLIRFASMSNQAQELAGYAVVDRGPPWIGAFQRVAFAAPGAPHHHILAETLAPEIDDATARAWIAAGYDEVGWRVLVARHGNAVVPELLSDLPPSFAGLHDIPALRHLRFVHEAPAPVIPELFGRLGNPMQPKATQDLLNALAAVYPQGMVSIVQWICKQPNALPVYHIAQALRLYRDWRERTGITLAVAAAAGNPISFDRWIAGHCALQRWDPHFVPQMLSSLPDLAMELVLEHFRTDDEKAHALLSAIRGVNSYHAGLLDRMLASDRLASLIPEVFQNCFDTFPADALRRCLDSPHIKQDILLWRLGASSNPLHRSVHVELINRALKEPMNLHHYGYIAGMLRSHTRYEVIALLEETVSPSESNAMWFVRTVEAARGERLISEIGKFRP
jgi:hypothetical protein